MSPSATQFYSKNSNLGFPPYVISNAQKEVIGSTDRDILLTLGEFMNFQIQWDLDNDWGRPSSNGTWNGLLGKVRRQETDIGTGHVGMVWPRAQIIDYTHYTYFLEVGHKTRKPIPKNPIFNIFLPYTNTVWITIREDYKTRKSHKQRKFHKRRKYQGSLIMKLAISNLRVLSIYLIIACFARFACLTRKY